MKVMSIVGTRPEIIRLSRVIHRLEAETSHWLVHTGQNWTRGCRMSSSPNSASPSPITGWTFRSPPSVRCSAGCSRLSNRCCCTSSLTPFSCSVTPTAAWRQSSPSESAFWCFTWRPATDALMRTCRRRPIARPGSLANYADESHLPDDLAAAERIYLTELLPGKIALDLARMHIGLGATTSSRLVLRTVASTCGLHGLFRRQQTWERAKASQILAGASGPIPLGRCRYARPRHITLIGASRSGTKLLRDALAQLAQVGRVPYDIGYIWRQGNEDLPSDILPPEQVSPRAQAFIGGFVNRYPSGGPATVIEKTVGNTLRIPVVTRVLPTPPISISCATASTSPNRPAGNGPRRAVSSTSSRRPVTSRCAWPPGTGSDSGNPLRAGGCAMTAASPAGVCATRTSSGTSSSRSVHASGAGPSPRHWQTSTGSACRSSRPAARRWWRTPRASWPGSRNWPDWTASRAGWRRSLAL